MRTKLTGILGRALAALAAVFAAAPGAEGLLNGPPWPATALSTTLTQAATSGG